MVASLMLLPSSSAEKAEVSSSRKTKTTDTATVPVKGFHKNGNKSFEGDMTIKRFVKRNGKLKAVGDLNGTVFGKRGGEKGTVDGKRVVAPVRIRDASCNILNLVLGPLDLNLLGLRIQLNRVVLDITGEPGPGNLLGNLPLCRRRSARPRWPAGGHQEHPQRHSRGAESPVTPRANVARYRRIEAGRAICPPRGRANTA